MIIENVILSGRNYGSATVKTGRYKEGGVALLLSDAETGEPLTKITVWLDVPPVDGAFWIKTWAENDGLLLLLGQAGLIETTGRVHEVNRWGSQAIEAKPRGELKDLVDAEVARW